MLRIIERIKRSIPAMWERYKVSPKAIVLYRTTKKVLKLQKVPTWLLKT